MTEDSRITPQYITSLREGEIFVFGSNKEGLHGGGAARIAYEEFGAEWGGGVGMAYAKEHPELTFLVTRIGCGIAGWRDSEIAPLFKEASALDNVTLPEEFWNALGL